MKTHNHILNKVFICALVLSACAPIVVTTETQTPGPTATTIVPSPTPRPEKVVSQNKPVRVSASWVVDPPDRAVDGSLNNWWGAGGPVPQWIEVDLEGIYSVSRIRIVNEGPTGYAPYQVYGRGPDNVNRLLHVFEGNKSNNQKLEFSPETPWEDISTIRIEINSGSGWVGFREIQIFSRDDPKPLPVSVEDSTPTFLAQVDPVSLEPINADNAIFLKQLAMLGRGPINDLAWSLDGTTLAVASPLGVWLYDPNDLKSSPRLLEGHTRDVLSVIFSPDGETVLSGSQDGTVKIWDAATAGLIRTVSMWSDFSHEVGNAPREDEVWSIAFSRDGKLLASGAYDGRIRLWNPTTGEKKSILQGHTRQISTLAFSPDGTLLASNSVDGTIIVWDVEKGSQRFSISAQTSEQRFAFSPDGNTLAIAYGGSDVPVQLYDMVSGEDKIVLTDHKEVISIVFGQNGLITSDLNGKLQLWDPVSGASRMIIDNAGWNTILALSPDGATLASNAWHGALQLWDLTAGNLTGAQIGHTRPITGIAFSPDGMSVASGNEDGLIWVWKVKSNTLDKAMLGHGSRVTDLAFSPDGKLLASSSFDRTVRLWDVASARQIAVLSGHESFVRCVAFSPDGKLVASGSTDQTVRLWDVETGEERAILSGHTGEVESVSFGPDGVWLASGSADKTIRIWDVATGKEAGVLTGNLSFVNDVAINTDGTRLVSAGADHSLRFWDLNIVLDKTVGRQLPIAKGHPGWILSVDYSSDGQIVASANLSSTSFYVTPGEIHLYSSDTAYPLVLLRGHTKRVTSIAFSPDGKLLASGSADGSVRLWGTQQKGIESASQPVIAAPTSEPVPVDEDPFVGKWAAVDPHDGSNMTLSIARSEDGNYGITLIDDGSTGCGVDDAGKPRVGIEIVFTATAVGSILHASSTSASCLSTPALLLDVKINQSFYYQTATDVIWDDVNRTDWKRRSSSSWRDNFDGSLAAGWRWLNEKSDKWNLTEKPGFLRIYVSPYKTGGQNLLLRSVPQSDFVITTHVLFEPNTNFQLAGLTIYQDEGNLLQMGLAFCDVAETCVGNGIYFDNILGGSFTGSNFATSVDDLSEAYLCLERRGEMVKSLFSYEGVTWFEFGSHPLPPDFKIIGVGLTVVGDSNTSDADIPADFDFFEFSEIP